MFDIAISIAGVGLIALYITSQITVNRLRGRLESALVQVKALSDQQSALTDDIVTTSRRFNVHRELMRANMLNMEKRYTDSNSEVQLRQWALAQAIERGFTPGSTLEEAEKYYNWITRPEDKK